MAGIWPPRAKIGGQHDGSARRYGEWKAVCPFPHDPLRSQMSAQAARTASEIEDSANLWSAPMMPGIGDHMVLTDGQFVAELGTLPESCSSEEVRGELQRVM